MGLDLLIDVVTAPAFTPDDVESERQVILEELHQAEDEGDDRVHALAHETLWGEHPLGREVLGVVDTIEAMGRDDIVGFLTSHYGPGNIVLAAAGAVDHGTVVEAGERFISSGSIRRRERERPDSPGPVRERALLRRPLEQAHLAVVWPGLPATDEDRYALAVLNQVFGGGLSSRLFQEVREERGLAYSVYSSVSSYCDAGSLIAYAGTNPDRVAEVHRVIMSVADDVAEHGITPREWEVARGFLEGATLLGLEDSSSVMARLGNHVCARGRVAPIDEQIERLRAVTPEDVQQVARRVLGTSPAICGVGPIDEADLDR